MPKNTIYLAYGSNLNLEQMGRRCPTAKTLGTTELHGYDLKFRGDDGNAVATIEPGEGSVPTLLWKLTPRDEAALDYYEGWPRLYRKEKLDVTLGDKTVTAMVYVMNDGFELGEPSPRYLDTIAEGYNDNGFDWSVLERAAALSSQVQAPSDAPQQEMGW